MGVGWEPGINVFQSSQVVPVCSSLETTMLGRTQETCDMGVAQHVRICLFGDYACLSFLTLTVYLFN